MANSGGPPSVRGMSLRDCTQGIRKGLQHPTVKFLREQMDKAGCTFWPSLFAAVNCSSPTCGGFYSSGEGIRICCNLMQAQYLINHVMIHELIHAYDECRAKNLDWNNCAHHACSEIRAYHLGGHCQHKRELLRSLIPVRANYPSRNSYYKDLLLQSFVQTRIHYHGCIKRSVFRSLQSNPYCHGEKGKDAIEDVWGICYNDTMPFDSAPSSNP